MIEIIVISLATALERRQHAKQQLDFCKLDFTFFDARTPATGARNDFLRIENREFLINTGRELTEGEIACYASHLALWKRCVELNKPIMIMEDDFLLGESFADACRQTASLIEQYGYIRMQDERRGKRIKVANIDNFDLYYYTKMPHSAMCYAITPRVAAAFIAESKYFDAPVDVLVKCIWRHRQRLYGLAPYPVRESNYSPLTGIPGRARSKKPFSIQLARALRKLNNKYRRTLFNALFTPPTPYSGGSDPAPARPESPA